MLGGAFISLACLRYNHTPAALSQHLIGRLMHLLCRQRWIQRIVWRWEQRCMEGSWRVPLLTDLSLQMDLTAGTCMPEPAASVRSPIARCRIVD